MHALDGDPVALLSSPRFKTMLVEISRKYEWVILDCPPTLGMSDARLVGQTGTMVLLVVRWDRTPMSAIQTGVRDLKLFGAELVGSIINGVDLRKFRAFGLGTTDREGYYHECRVRYEEA
jgi:polysaccharide biosynthesis transport protein